MVIETFAALYMPLEHSAHHSPKGMEITRLDSTAIKKITFQHRPTRMRFGHHSLFGTN